MPSILTVLAVSTSTLAAPGFSWSYTVCNFLGDKEPNPSSLTIFVSVFGAKPAIPSVSVCLISLGLSTGEVSTESSGIKPPIPFSSARVSTAGISAGAVSTGTFTAGAVSIESLGIKLPIPFSSARVSTVRSSPKPFSSARVSIAGVVSILLMPPLGSGTFFNSSSAAELKSFPLGVSFKKSLAAEPKPDINPAVAAFSASPVFMNDAVAAPSPLATSAPTTSVAASLTPLLAALAKALVRT